MIKALFFDMDGTLLNSESKLSVKTVEALEDCKRKGIMIFPATGRPPLLDRMLSLNRQESLLLGDGGVFYNGGCVSRNGRKLYTTIDDNVMCAIDALISGMPHLNMAVQMVDEKHSFRFDLSDEFLIGWGIDRDMIEPYESGKRRDIVKLFLFSFNDEIDMKELYVRVNALGLNIKAYMTGQERLLEIVAPAVSKKTGIEKLLDHYRLDPSEIAVFGDDSNDLEMLSGFRNSVAMGNAKNEIKAAAGYVTLSNAEEGVAHALKDFLHII